MTTITNLYYRGSRDSYVGRPVIFEDPKTNVKLQKLKKKWKADPDVNWIYSYDAMAEEQLRRNLMWRLKNNRMTRNETIMFHKLMKLMLSSNKYNTLLINYITYR